MNDKNNKLNIGELKQSASPSSAKADVTAENIYNRKKALIKMGVIGALLIVMIIFGTISWFTQNREVESSGMTIKTSTLPFDIATKGASIRNSDIMSTEDGKTVMNTKNGKFIDGSSGTYENQSGVSGTYYTGDSLLLRFTPNADDPSTTDIDESIAPDISPGSSGELNLFVIPKTNDAMNVKVSLNVVAFAEIDKYTVSTVINQETQAGEEIRTKNGTQIIEINSDFAAAANAVNNSTAAGEADKYIAAANYLKGHILFFGEEGNPDNSDESLRYYYSTPYTTSNEDSQITFNYPVPANKNGKAVQVPIYWMWTNTLGQIALKNNTSTQMNGISVVQNITTFPNTPLTDKEKLIKYVKDNKDIVLKDWRNIELSETEELVTIPQLMVSSEPHITEEKAMELLVDELIDDIANTNNFSRLSKCYNAADYDIGTKIRYFMIEVTVEAAQ